MPLKHWPQPRPQPQTQPQHQALAQLLLFLPLFLLLRPQRRLQWTGATVCLLLMVLTALTCLLVLLRRASQGLVRA